LFISHFSLPIAHSLPLPLTLTLLAACGGGFTPRSVLDDLRVIAVESTPLEAGPGETVSLTPFLSLPRGASLTKAAWTFCPLAAPAQAAFACALPACETALDADPDTLTATATPHALLMACFAAAAGGSNASMPDPASLPETIEGVFRLVVESSDGGRREVVLRYPVWLAGPPTVRNAPPRILSVEARGAAPAADGSWPAAKVGEVVELRAVADPASAEAYVDASGRDRTEEILISWYTTAGRFDDDRTLGLDTTNGWRLRAEDAGVADATFWVVARDLRGGQAVAGPYRIPIAP
jgi:hypothetical protein